MIVIRKFLLDSSGSTAIEYALLASLVAVGVIGAMMGIGNSTTVKLEDVADEL